MPSTLARAASRRTTATRRPPTATIPRTTTPRATTATCTRARTAPLPESPTHARARAHAHRHTQARACAHARSPTDTHARARASCNWFLIHCQRSASVGCEHWQQRSWSSPRHGATFERPWGNDAHGLGTHARCACKLPVARGGHLPAAASGAGTWRGTTTTNHGAKGEVTLLAR
jgi:hypothetical protein